MTLELRGIHKHFGAVRANDGVSISIEPGTLHGILGENGAGKSTLMKVLSGFIEADAGEISLDDTTLDLSSPADAIAAGIGMLHQDPLVFLQFTVLDNFLLGSPGSARVDRRAGLGELSRMSEELGFSFDPLQSARTLTVGERQQLEITRLLWLGAKVLILDEPTTGISAAQREQLFAVLRRLAGEGLIVLFVSHKLEEVEELCHSVTVMRSGKVVGAADMPVPPSELVAMMFGKMIEEPGRPEPMIGEPMLELSDFEVTSRTTAIRGLNLTVGAGEIIGLAGLEGSGQRGFLDALSGLVPPDGGKATLDGIDITDLSYRDHLGVGVHYLPAGRLEEGLVAGLTIEEHIALTTREQPFFIDWGVAEANAQASIDEFNVKGLPTSTAESLSGGNQQRLLLSLMPGYLKLLLMEHPTRGLDIESAEYVWSKILQRRSRRTSIVFASADLDELLTYSDRILVCFSGNIIKMLEADDTDGEELGYLIGGKERS
ncbi:MAG: ATP-binding cassette domain-containing protein [Actinomycetota bacterium]|nr:ATP-binding cassette domain-containing protein [Actinomycetota bacterium]